jgi:hypothetical protein
MDTVESVLSRAHKVLIDSKAGGSSGGNMFYLPLDKLLEKANARGDDNNAAASGRDDGGSASAQSKEPDSVTVEARGRGDR